LIGQPEDACFDCKEWPARDDDAQKMLAKAACGLTNAEGGVLVIGLKAESKPKDEPDVVGSIAPVKDTSLAKSRVLNLIGNLVEPGIVGIEVTEVSLQKKAQTKDLSWLIFPRRRARLAVRGRTGSFISVLVLEPFRWNIFRSKINLVRGLIRSLNCISCQHK
jgi:hypothetical protein